MLDPVGVTGHGGRQSSTLLKWLKWLKFVQFVQFVKFMQFVQKMGIPLQALQETAEGGARARREVRPRAFCLQPWPRIRIGGCVGG